MYLIAKSLHLIGAISWMAGLFYLVRIMVYHAEAKVLSGEPRDLFARQYALMERRAYGIIVQPAVVITWSFGTMMLCLQPLLLQMPWLIAKLIFLVLLSIYTHYCKGQMRVLASEEAGPSHLFYRVLNEVPTILMVAIVFLAVLKYNLNWWYFGIGVGGFTVLIGWAVYRVNKKGKLAS